MLTDMDNTLRTLLVRRVPLDPGDVDVSFDCPKREWSAKVLKPTVNLYLYDLRENLALRQPSWTVERGQNGHADTGLRRPPVYLDLSYFITAWARNVADEHHLLWRVMAALMREQEISADLLQGGMRQAGPPVKAVTAQADGVLRNPGEFWSALDNDLKPAVTYTATLCVDLDVLVEAPLVLTRVVDVATLESERLQRLVAIGGTVRGRPTRRGSPPAGPVAGAVVSFPALGIAVHSGSDGRYVVPQVAEGTHRVLVAGPGGATSEAEIQVPSPNYDLEV